MYFILFNPSSAGNQNQKKIDKLEAKLSKLDKCYRYNILELSGNEKVFISLRTENDSVILCGGDGTVNHFANQIAGCDYKCRIFAFKCGIANDLSRDFKGNPFEITDLLKNLPRMVINGTDEYKIVNSIGLGIDGEVCVLKERYDEAQIRKSYFKIAKESFKLYKPFSVDIKVDGELKHFDNVWIVAVCSGRYFGNGMKVAPKSCRTGEYLDLCVAHSMSRYKLYFTVLLSFLGLHTIVKNVEYIKGKEFEIVPSGYSTIEYDGEVLQGIEKIDVYRQ